MREAPAPGVVVPRHEVRAGELLAEGGEGRVYELTDQPGVLYKAYRSPARRAPLEALVRWRTRLAGDRPDLDARLQASAAWPTGLVVERGLPEARVAGLLLPRAPRRFSIRHRDGTSRLATLSYLTSDPRQRAAAYGLALPPPFGVERIGIVYALARLLEAFQSSAVRVGHGDLSAKNVLWSLERGPEVFVIDCDSSELYDATATPVDAEHRRRAMTPNWDDPAIPPGSNPTLASDRYSLGLIFLRVVGAAHFPIQGRQRTGEPLTVDFGVAPSGRRVRSLESGAAVWDVCSRSLSAAHPEERPLAVEWVGALEQVLDDLGAFSTVRAVWAAQGGGSPAPIPALPAARPDADVTVRPVPAVARPAAFERLVVTPAADGPAWRRPASAAAAGGFGPAAPGRGLPGAPARGAPSSPVAAPVTQPPVLEQIRRGVGDALRAVIGVHRRALASLATDGARADGARRLLLCAVMDFVLIAVTFFVVAVITSPLFGR